MDPARLLLVDDEAIALRNLERTLKKEGYAIRTARTGQEALALLDSMHFDVVLSDVRLPGADGQAILRRCKTLSPETEVILVTGYASLEGAVEAMRDGAFHYLAKPFRLEEVRRTVADAVEKARLRQENRRLKEELACLKDAPARAVPPSLPSHGEARLPTLEERELEYIRWVLAETGGNQTAAAHILGIDRVSLWRKLKKHSLGQ